MSNTPLMKCGHSGMALQNGKPACVICAGIHPGYNVVDDNPPDLSKRRARCAYYGKAPYKDECNRGHRGDRVCHCEEPSSPTNLAFFEYKPKEEFDVFYCGCHSWD